MKEVTMEIMDLSGFRKTTSRLGDNVVLLGADTGLRCQIKNMIYGKDGLQVFDDVYELEKHCKENIPSTVVVSIVTGDVLPFTPLQSSPEKARHDRATAKNTEIKLFLGDYSRMSDIASNFIVVRDNDSDTY